ncbi:hypothetical protein KAU15_02835 [candidate division WOR-3 bacterium]|nr:hypothetical protein [candidate division WOR-3 bacterium]
MKRLLSDYKILILIIILLLTSCQPASVTNDYDADDIDYGVEVFAKVVNNRDYYPQMYDLFDNAEKTIHVIMFSMRYYSYDPDTEEMKLMNKLAEASLNGIDVRIILEQSDWGDINESNYESGDYLKQYGVKVRYDPMTITTHCKLFIIDSIFTVVGSTNWSKSAVSYNNEANVMLTSSSISNDFIDYFEVIWNSSYERE